MEHGPNEMHPESPFSPQAAASRHNAATLALLDALDAAASLPATPRAPTSTTAAAASTRAGGIGSGVVTPAAPYGSMGSDSRPAAGRGVVARGSSVTSLNATAPQARARRALRGWPWRRRRRRHVSSSSGSGSASGKRVPRSVHPQSVSLGFDTPQLATATTATLFASQSSAETNAQAAPDTGDRSEARPRFATARRALALRFPALAGGLRDAEPPTDERDATVAQANSSTIRQSVRERGCAARAQQSREPGQVFVLVSN